ncbi:MAG: type 4a pilus biogenesis protein PilO [Campylobacterales bacterium]
MKFIEDKLEELDAYFEPKKESEKWLIILGIAGIISYIAYAYFLPYTESMFKKSEAKKQTLEKRIADNEKYLAGITVNGDRNYKIKQYDKEIARKKKKIESLKSDIALVNNNLSKLSDMLFNQKNWSIFLNSITQTAQKENVDINYINNEFLSSNGNFGHILEINLGCKGSYKDIVKFINDIEQSKLVTDIYGTNIYLDKNTSDIVADINISVWGINH